jgi:carboxyl-terminal processing protease
VRARGAVAFGVALLAALVVGLWLGGHPGKLPGFLRDAFVAEPAGLTGEAAEAIRDNYFRPVGTTELENSSLQGMVRELRRRHHDRFSDYFSPETLASFNEQIEGRFSGIGLSIVPVPKGLRVTTVFPGSPTAGSNRATSWSRSKANRSPAYPAPWRRRRSRVRKGPRSRSGCSTTAAAR